MKRAFLTGVGGQDGHYLARLLLGKNYEVYGCGRPGSLGDARGEELRALGVVLVEVDLQDAADVSRCLADIRPSEIYNLAGNSFVPASWDDPVGTAAGITAPVINLLEAMRRVDESARFYQSSSSELFALSGTSPQDEETPIAPANPYGASKALAHHLVRAYRQRYGMFAVCGILYNHESPRRPAQFVTRKITLSACRIKKGVQKELVLGDLDAVRDWGFAGDHTEAMWRMLRQDVPHDFVIGTGIPHTVRDLCRIAFERVGLDYQSYVRLDPAFVRPPQTTQLLSNPARARSLMGWTAETSFERLIGMMMDADWAAVDRAPAG